MDVGEEKDSTREGGKQAMYVHVCLRGREEELESSGQSLKK